MLSSNSLCIYLHILGQDCFSGFMGLPMMLQAHAQKSSQYKHLRETSIKFGQQWFVKTNPSTILGPVYRTYLSFEVQDSAGMGPPGNLQDFKQPDQDLKQKPVALTTNFCQLICLAFEYFQLSKVLIALKMSRNFQHDLFLTF